MNLIVTEKPSVARDFKAVVNKDKYTVVSAVGHLLELFSPEDYSQDWKKWSLESLPIIPDKLQYKPIEATQKSLDAIGNALKYTYEKIIIATDAGREGELIARLILNHFNIPYNNVYRFWSSAALTPEVIKKGLNEIKPSSEYDKLAQQGLSRAGSDWTVGINFTRFLTKKIGDIFSFGRVQSALLMQICQRHDEIAQFQPKTYYQAKAAFSKDGGEEFYGFLTVNKENKFSDKPNPEKGPAEVVSIQEEKKVKKSPQLLSLTQLQRIANKQFSYSASKTLEIAQSLYEKHKCLSYPRTPSSVMAETDVELCQKILDRFAQKDDTLHEKIDWDKVKTSYKRIFNNAKLEDHHALVPINEAPGDLNTQEKNIYNQVSKSFLAAFCGDYEYISVEITTKMANNDYITKGIKPIILGWTNFINQDTEEGKKESNTLVPDVHEKDSLNCSGIEIIEGKTKPPDHYTEASLLALMEHPKGYDKGCGIGTPATRASIIEKILSREYVRREKKKITVTEKGLHFQKAVKSIPGINSITNIMKTAEWEQKLNTDPASFYDKVNVEMRNIIRDEKQTQLEGFGKKWPDYGKCPKCQNGHVRKGQKNYYCSEYKNCDFKIWIDFCGTKLNETTVKALISGKKSKELQLKKKNGDAFKASLILKEDNYKIGFAPWN